MHGSRLLAVFLVALPCLVFGDQFDDLRLKRRAVLTGGAGIDYSLPQVQSRLAGIESTARRYWAGMDKTSERAALWSDLAGATSSAQITSIAGRLRAMALAWATPGQKLYADEALLADVRSGLAWLLRNRYNAAVPKEYDNWWDWEIGTPLQLGDLIVLLHDRLTADEIAQYAAAVDRFDSDPRVMIVSTVSTGANRVWKCTGAILRAIAVKDTAKLRLASDALSPVFAYVTAGDGFYEDGSFIQHGRHAYTGGYGTSFLSQLADLLYLLSGSPWDVKDPGRANVYRWVFASFQPVVYRGAMMDMLRGREISRAGSTDHSAGHAVAAAILRLSDLAPAPAAGQMKSMVKEWLAGDTVREWSSGAALDQITPLARLLADSSVSRRGEITGSWIFAGMDRVVHIRPGWALGIALHSTRISNYESINNENLHAWHTGDGMTYLYNDDLGQFSGGFWPTVDPQRLPGTTVAAGSTPRPNRPNGSPVAGGATIQGYSAAMLRLRPDGSQLDARKSWFLLDDAVVAMGSEISAAPEQRVETIVENRIVGGDARLTVAEDGKWASLGNNLAYYFPQGSAWKSERVERSGAWRDINRGGAETPISRTYQTIWFDHGVAPKAASYEYAILPGKNARSVAAFAATPTFRIVENSPAAHAVVKPAAGLRAVNFWSESGASSAGITSDRSASVVTVEKDGVLEIGIADPSQAFDGIIHVEVDRAAARILERDEAVSVERTSPTLRLAVNVAGGRGRTFKLKCAPSNK